MAGYILDNPSDAQEQGGWNAVSGLNIVLGSFGSIRAIASKDENHAPRLILETMPFLPRLGRELFILKDEKQELRQEADPLEAAQTLHQKIRTSKRNLDRGYLGHLFESNREGRHNRSCRP